MARCRTTPSDRPPAGKPVKPARKAAPATTAAAKLAEAPRPAKEDKPRKPKLVRDSFTIPKSEYVVLEALKQRAIQMGTPAKKSELLRAGIKLLAATSDAALAEALAAVPAIKTGRPAKG